MLADIKAGTTADALDRVYFDPLSAVFDGGNIRSDHGTDRNTSVAADAFFVGVN